MALKTFAAQVSDIMREREEAMTKVMREAIGDTVEAVIDTTPVDTGTLKNSFVSALNGGEAGTEGATSYVATIAGMELGDSARFGYKMPYALRLELGFDGADSFGRTYTQGGRYWVSTALEGFQANVDAAVAKHRS